MRLMFAGWWRTVDGALTANAASLVATTVVTSGFGAIFWWLAAHLFAEDTVGLAAAAVSAMMLLGTIGMLGFGTLMLGELASRPKNAGDLILTASLTGGIVGLILGTLTALATPRFFGALQPLSASIWDILLFSVGSGVTAAVLVLDQATIGLLRGEIQLWRNALFAAAKLAALVLAGAWIATKSWSIIYSTWIAGYIISMAGVLVVTLVRGLPNWLWPRRLEFRTVWSKSGGHFLLNLALQVPGMLMPVLVTVILSPAANAVFYVAWMIVGLAFAGPIAVSTTLYAVGTRGRDKLAARLRFSLGLSLLVGGCGSALLLVVGGQVLSVFGPSYAREGEAILRLLALAVLPLIVKTHYIALRRVSGEFTLAAVRVGFGGVLEIVAACTGALLGGVSGLSLGWVVAMYIEAVVFGQTVAKFARERSLAAGLESGAPSPSRVG